MFKKTTTVVAAISAALLASQVSAASIDIRGEHKAEDKANSGRVKISENFGNFTVGAELKFKPSEDGGLVGNGHELDLGYNYQINDNWKLQPGMPIGFSSSGVTYKPQLRLSYTLSDVPLTFSARYRHEFTEKSNGSREQLSKWTANVNYNFERVALGLEANHDTLVEGSRKLYNGKNTNYDYNMKVAYTGAKAWTPYFELGDVSVTPVSDKRQLRARVGASYRF